MSIFFSGERQRWLSHQKKIMINYFQQNLKNKKALKKKECEEFLSKHKTEFDGVEWLRVKTFIFNEYRQKE